MISTRAFFLLVLEQSLAYHDGISQQIHLSIGVDTSEMIVTWALNYSSSSSAVKYWQEDNPEKIVSQGPYWIRQYNATKGYRIQYDYSSPWFYSARLGPLETSSTYEYQIDSGDIHAFQTVHKEKYPMHIGVLGDVGQTNFSNETFFELQSYEPRPASVLLVGDLSYADGELDRWDSYERMAETAFSEIPVSPLPGNHETEADFSGIGFTSYRNRYPASGKHLPDFVKPGHLGHSEYDATMYYDFGASFYAYTLGPVRIITLNTYVSAQPGSRQQAFLEREIACTNRTQSPWIIVGTHAPYYSTNAKHRADTERNTAKHRESLEPILARGAIALVFAGHVHAYERSHPVCMKHLDSACPTYITIGDGGNRELLYDLWPFADENEPWSAYRNGTRYGFGIIDFHDDMNATWKWLPNDFDGEPRDSVHISNPYFHPSFFDYSFSPDDNFTFHCDADLIHEVDRRAEFSASLIHEAASKPHLFFSSRQFFLVSIFFCLLLAAIVATLHAFHNAVDHPHFTALASHEVELTPSVSLELDESTSIV